MMAKTGVASKDEGQLPARRSLVLWAPVEACDFAVVLPPSDRHETADKTHLV
jgi:hypothetical protein